MPRRWMFLTVGFAALLVGAGLFLALTIERPAGPGPRRPRVGNLPFLGRRAPAPSPTPAPLPPSPAPETPPALRRVVERDIIAPTVSRDGKSLLYISRENGHILSSDLSGEGEVTIVNRTVLGVFGALWSPGKDRVVVRYAEGATVRTFVTAIATGTPVTFLPPETSAAAWSPDGRSLAYLTRRNAETALVIADPQNRNARAVYTTPIPDFTLQWVSRSAILLVSRPSAFAPSAVVRFHPGNRTSDILIRDPSGVVALPSPDGESFIYSHSANGTPQPLRRFTLSPPGGRELPAVTIAEKCGFGKKVLYCGLPGAFGPEPMPDAWYQGSVALNDAMVAVDPSSGGVRTLTDGTHGFDAVSLFTSPDERYLFFQDRTTGVLWRLTLEEAPRPE